MIVKGTKIGVGERKDYRCVAVEFLAPQPLPLAPPGLTSVPTMRPVPVQVVTLDREGDPTRSEATVSEVAARRDTVRLRFTDGTLLSLPVDAEVMVAESGYIYRKAVEVIPGETLVPLGKWQAPAIPPAAKVVESVAAGEPVDVLYAVRVVGPRQNYAIAAGVYLAADKE